MAFFQNPIVKWATRFAGKLRFPHLFLVTASLFLFDLALPDLIPFADELLLGLGTLLLGNLRKRKSEGEGRESVSGMKRGT